MKIAIFSANYSPGKSLDSFRTGFLNQLEKIGIEVLFVEANAYVHDLNGRRLTKHSDKDMLEGIKKFNPNGVIFINACGRVPRIQDYLVKNKIRSISWFWDHPAFLSLNLIEPSLYHEYAVANEVFKEWLNNYFKKDGIIIHSISFPMLSHPQQREEKLTVDKYLKRKDEALFMGTLWENCFDEVINKAIPVSEDIISEKNKLIGIIDNLIQCANLGKCNGVFHNAIKDIMGHYGDTSVFINLANNYLSSLERKEIIAILSRSEHEMKLYGTPEKAWTNFIDENELKNTRLIYKKNYIGSYVELINICENAKVGLNIFHKQNQGGGTNFRINDYVLARTPILSNRNAVCEKIFKDKEAAFYFNDKNDLLDVCDIILKNPDLAVSSVNQAYEIGVDLFSMTHIVNDLLKLLSLKIPSKIDVKKGSVSYQTRKSDAITFFRNKSCKKTEMTIVGDCMIPSGWEIEIKLHRLFRASVKLPFFYYHNNIGHGVLFCSKFKLLKGYTKLSINRIKKDEQKILAEKHFILLK